ncbi:MAG: orotate phosphoribosyltransferase [Nitrospirae bacterium]|nr:orotate phosphoribosyltransferase [Nitrospirota bacterium]
MISEKEVLDIFKQCGAFLTGHFKLSSGLHSPQYLQAALVLQYPEYAGKLCSELAEYFKESEIDLVAAPALGGIIVAHEVARALGVRSIFAERQEGKLRLRRGFSINKSERVIVVEDVVTTGGSIRETMDVIKDSGGIIKGVGAIIDRSEGKVNLGFPLISLLSLTIPIYEPKSCPLCKERSIAIKPGSRWFKGP